MGLASTLAPNQAQEPVGLVLGQAQLLVRSPIDQGRFRTQDLLWNDPQASAAHQHLEALEFLFDAHLTRVLYAAALGN